jgi:hypothetical protein
MMPKRSKIKIEHSPTDLHHPDATFRPLNMILVIPSTGDKYTHYCSPDQDLYQHQWRNTVRLADTVRKLILAIKSSAVRCMQKPYFSPSLEAYTATIRGYHDNQQPILKVAVFTIVKRQ